VQWFDGHLDLAYIAQHGRDLCESPEHCGGTLQPATVTFSSLAAGGVTRAISTLFVRQSRDGVDGDYCFSNEAEAFRAAMRQVDMHQVWEAERRIAIAKDESPKTKDKDPLLRVALAIEGAACLRCVEDADLFAAAGVRMVSLAWAEGSKWAGGDQSGGDLTADGKALARHLDQLGIAHDVSHLSEQAFWSLLETASGPVVASHSNCRTLLPGARHPERHLSDAQINALAARPGSIIGINLFARFLIPPDELTRRRATCADVVQHLDHVAQLAGRRDFLALGSDMDSGFGADLLPVDLRGPQQLIHLSEALSAAGWSDAEVHQFANRWEELPGFGHV